MCKSFTHVNVASSSSTLNDTSTSGHTPIPSDTETDHNSEIVSNSVNSPINNAQPPPLDSCDYEDVLPRSPVIPFQTSSRQQLGNEPIIISGSPAKSIADIDMWIPKLGLFVSDMHVLSGDQWLTDSVIYAAQSLLHEHTKGTIFGWQSTQCSNREKLFNPVPPRTPFIQVLHVGNCHWITTSNVTHEGGSISDAVNIYDSGRATTVTSEVKKLICSFFKSSSDSIHFDLMNIQSQLNGSDCGLFALACATELAYGKDPVLCRWDCSMMRPHLIKCLEQGKMIEFPTDGRRRVPLGMRIRKSTTETIYCTCRMPNVDKQRAMIKCDRCLKWFHKDCMSLDIKKSYRDEEWVCYGCIDFLKL